MSMQLPLRSRLFPLQQQCPLQRGLYRVRQPSLSPTTRAFSSTPRFYRKPLTAEQKQSHNVVLKRSVRDLLQSAPSVSYNQLMEGGGAMNSMRGRDMGLLDGTMIRAPFSRLPGVLDRRLYRYFWKLFKSKAQSFVSRFVYRRCIEKKGFRRWLPIDFLQRRKWNHTAKLAYNHIYQDFAKGNGKTIERLCLYKVSEKFLKRMKDRGPIEMKWQLEKWKSARVVSDRSALFGDQFPDCAIRQVIVRLESVQSLHVKSKIGPMNDKSLLLHKTSGWVPRKARQLSKQKQQQQQGQQGQQELESLDNGQHKTVIEYMVLQQQVWDGKEDKLKVWGFTEPGTLEGLDKEDKELERRMAQEVELQQKYGISSG